MRRSLLAVVLLATFAACAPLPDEDVASSSAAALVSGPITNGPPGGGLGFCCIRSDGHRWTVGDVDPVTRQVMTSQPQVNGACASGHLPVRQAC